MSTWPSASPSRVALASAAGTSRLSAPTFSPVPAKRSRKVAACCRAKSVVGQITATCDPDEAATNAARSATSVLPKPTSPHTSRSIGRPAARSSSTSAVARSWSSVSAQGNLSRKAA